MASAEAAEHRDISDDSIQRKKESDSQGSLSKIQPKIGKMEGGKNNSVDKEESKEAHVPMGTVIRKLGVNGYPRSNSLLDEDFSEIGSYLMR